MSGGIYNIPIFIINMPNRQDRKNHMIKLMDDIGFVNYSFIIPYKADNNTKLLFEKLIGKKSTLSLSKISHNMTYLDILRYDTDKMIIFEDDIIPTKSIENIKKDLSLIFLKYPKDSTMIYLEMCYENCKFLDNPMGNLFVKLDNPICAASIFYPDKILRKKLYDYLVSDKNQIYKNPIDIEFENLIKNQYINAYILNLLFIQDDIFGSDLEGSNGYGKKQKNVLPICSNYEKTMRYVNMDKNIENPIKDKFSNKKDIFTSENIFLGLGILLVLILVIKFLFSKNK